MFACLQCKFRPYLNLLFSCALHQMFCWYSCTNVARIGNVISQISFSNRKCLFNFMQNTDHQSMSPGQRIICSEMLATSKYALHFKVVSINMEICCVCGLKSPNSGSPNSSSTETILHPLSRDVQVGALPPYQNRASPVWNIVSNIESCQSQNIDVPSTSAANTMEHEAELPKISW